MPKNVCVLGGSGFVGQHVVHRLVARGCNVRIPTRRRERAKELIVLPTVEAVEADIHDQETLRQLFTGMDAVINLVGILHERRVGRPDKPDLRRGDFHDVHIELPRKVVHACAGNGVRRLLHMSALHADPNAPSAYLRSKGLGEAVVRESGMLHSDDEFWYLDGPKLVKGHGLQWTILRPSVIFGPRDGFLNLFAGLARVLPVLVLACPEARFQPVFVEDVARAFVECLDDPRTIGKSFDLCGPQVYTLRELVEYVARTIGRERSIIGLGPTASYLQAFAMELLPVKLMTRDNYYSMQVDSVCDCAFPFDFAPTPLESVVPAYLAPGERDRYAPLRDRARR